MNVITFEDEAYQSLVEKINSLSLQLEVYHQRFKPEEAWVNNEDVCNYLGVSSRTLQRLRNNGEITYSTLGSKFYYTISEIQRVLESRKIRSVTQSVDELCDKYKERINSMHNTRKI